MNVRLLCGKCGASLVPCLSGLRCPRLTACGRGGYVETLMLPVSYAATQRDGVQA